VKVGKLNGLLFENLSLSTEQFAKRGNRRTAAYVELARCKSHYFAGKYDVALEYSHHPSGVGNMQAVETNNTDLSGGKVVRVTGRGATAGVGLFKEFE
jgi:hypothetical protein